MPRRIPLFLLFVTIATLFSAGRALAQSGEFVSDVNFTYEFGDAIVITGVLDPAQTYETVSIELSFPGDSRTLTSALQPAGDGAFTFTHLISDRFVQAFSEVSFRFLLETPEGQVLATPPFVFYYSDNRFEWRMLEDGPFRVHWYEGDLPYVRGALDAAVEGYSRAQAALQTGAPESVDIYLYASLADYQFARGQMGQLWAGGHADPASGLVLVSIPPGAEAELEQARKIPHEMAHLALFQAAGAGYWNLPAWLNEGFSSMMETFPNPDYDFLVSSAIAGNSLGSLSALCETFPQDAESARMAYAQSTSVVRYIDETYGDAGLRAIVEAYASGAGCTKGTLVEPVGRDLAGLEADWRETLNAGVPEPDQLAGAGVGGFVPWLLVLAAVLVGPVVVLAGSGMKKGESHGG